MAASLYWNVYVLLVLVIQQLLADSGVCGFLTVDNFSYSERCHRFVNPAPCLFCGSFDL